MDMMKKYFTRVLAAPWILSPSRKRNPIREFREKVDEWKEKNSEFVSINLDLKAYFPSHRWEDIEPTVRKLWHLAPNAILDA